MKKLMISFIVLLSSLNCFAHGADVSTIILKEQDNHTWTLQVRSSIDAFRKEIHKYFIDTPYTSEEMFKEQVFAYSKNTFQLAVNDDEPILLKHGIVRLGHETTVHFNKIELPKEISSLKITGDLFKDIYRSTAKLLILKKGAEKTVFMLNKKNRFTVNLELKNNKFIHVTNIPKKETPKNYTLLAVCISVTIVAILLFVFRNKLLKSFIKNK